ncbi:MAG TPA: CDP-glucose 4,6-dehydratase [Azospirillum sp.]|nr:CDP-glucose 4,6-dehydratase [Azospirillum sp.]
MNTPGITPDFWSGRRVFVTGHTGFKGGWLCLALGRLGAIVSGYALEPEGTPNVVELTGGGDGMTSTIGDLRDRVALGKALAAAEPEVVFHLAAQPLVRRAYAEPLETFDVNVMGTANLLEAVRGVGSVKAVVVVTTDKVYDNQEWAWPYRETDRLGGKEPYGASKACCELVVDAYRHSYLEKRTPPVAVASVRAGNIVGGGDWAVDRLVPDAMRAFSAGRRLMIRNPAAVRPWQHVLEPVRGYLMIAERLIDHPAAAVGAWNFGPLEEDCQPVSRIVDRLAMLWGDDAGWSLEAGAQPYEARLLTLDSSRVRAEIGWKPVWRLARALEETVAWYRAFYRREDLTALTMRQIEENVIASVMGR